VNVDLIGAAEFLGKHFLATILLLACGLIVRKRSAATRHSYWLMGLVWILAMPFLSLKLPKIEYRAQNVTPLITSQTPWLAKPQTDQPALARQPTPRAPETSGRTLPVQPDRYSTFSMGPIWRAAGVIYGWVAAIGILLFLLRLATAMRTARWFDRNATEGDPETQRNLARAAKTMGLRRTPCLMASRKVSVPLTFGMFPGVVVVPVEGASYAALLHECAHIRRQDWAALVLGRLVCALFLFNPLLRLAEREMRQAAESAADDLVVACGVASTEYATELVDIASRLSRMRFEYGIAIVNGQDLKERLKGILREGRRETRVPVRTSLATMLVGGLLATSFAVAHYSRFTVEGVPNGVVSVGNGLWVRVVGITKLQGSNAITWDLQGRYLPTALGPSKFWLDHPTWDPKNPPTHFVIIGTNANNSDGFAVGSGLGQEMAANVGCEAYPLPKSGIGFGMTTMFGEMLLAFPVWLPEKAFDGSVYISAPTERDWKTVATLRFGAGETAPSQNGFKLLNAHPDAQGNLRFALPKRLEGRAQIHLEFDKTEETILVDKRDSAEATVHFPDPSWSLRRAELQTQAPLAKLLFQHLPAYPGMSKAEANGQFGLPIQTALDGRYRFSNGEVLSLESISDPGPHGQSWAYDGSNLKNERSDLPTNMDNLGPLLFARKLRFKDVPGQLSSPDSAVHASARYFDDAGIEWPVSDRVDRAMPGYDVVEAVLRPGQAMEKADVILRVKDPSSKSVQELTVAKAFDSWAWSKPQTDTYLNGRHVDKVYVAKGNPILNDAPFTPGESSMELLDAKGVSIPMEQYSTSGDRIEFMLPKSEGERVRKIRIEWRPYVFVRFPNVALLPKQK
jgi:beta-lactamase regulating signal transducer with metallopeptidase domain